MTQAPILQYGFSKLYTERKWRDWQLSKSDVMPMDNRTKYGNEMKVLTYSLTKLIDTNIDLNG